MRFILIAAITFAVIGASCPSYATGYHHIALAPIVHSGGGGAGGGAAGGGAVCAGGCPWIAGFIGVVTVAIVIHEALGPACASRGLKNGYDEPRLWRPMCKKPGPIAVRG